MVRLNITMPEDIVRKLKKIKNKSRFISEAVYEKIKREEKKPSKKELIEAYKELAKEDLKVVQEWEHLAGEGID